MEDPFNCPHYHFHCKYSLLLSPLVAVDHDFLITWCWSIQVKIIANYHPYHFDCKYSLLLSPYLVQIVKREKSLYPPLPLVQLIERIKIILPGTVISLPGTVMEADNRWWRTELNSAGRITFKILQIKHNIRQIDHAFYQISNTCTYRIRKEKPCPPSPPPVRTAVD